MKKKTLKITIIALLVIVLAFALLFLLDSYQKDKKRRDAIGQLKYQEVSKGQFLSKNVKFLEIDVKTKRIKVIDERGMIGEFDYKENTLINLYKTYDARIGDGTKTTEVIVPSAQNTPKPSIEDLVAGSKLDITFDGGFVINEINYYNKLTEKEMQL